jgi:hypothetical protein
VAVDDGDAVEGVGTNALKASSRRSSGRCHAGLSASVPPRTAALPFCRRCVFGFARFVGGGEQDDVGECWFKWSAAESGRLGVFIYTRARCPSSLQYARRVQKARRRCTPKGNREHLYFHYILITTAGEYTSANFPRRQSQVQSPTLHSIAIPADAKQRQKQ